VNTTDESVSPTHWSPGHIHTPALPGMAAVAPIIRRE
jgi:hypothetical protein